LTPKPTSHDSLELLRRLGRWAIFKAGAKGAAADDYI
jgi:hypothetical protein